MGHLLLEPVIWKNLDYSVSKWWYCLGPRGLQTPGTSFPIFRPWHQGFPHMGFAASISLIPEGKEAVQTQLSMLPLLKSGHQHRPDKQLTSQHRK